MMQRYLSFLPFLVLASVFFSDARADYTTLKTANRLFEAGKPAEAAAQYQNVIEKEPESRNGTVAAFNLGNTLVHMERCAKAAVHFREIASKHQVSDEFRAEARFNAGNAFARLALSSGEKNRKKKLFETALQEYRKALLINPDDQDTKINFEIIRRHLNALNSHPETGKNNVRNPQNSLIDNDIVSSILEQAVREEQRVLRERYRTSSKTRRNGSNKDW